MKKLIFIVSLCVVCSLSQATLLDITAAEGVTIRTGSTGQYTDTNFTSSGRMIVGDVSTTDVIRGVAAFSLDDPALVGATINSVTVTIVAAATDGGSDSAEDFTIQECSSFVESEVTWNSRNSSTLWTIPGGDYGAVLDTKTLNPTTITGGTEVVFSGAALTAAVSDNIGGAFYSLFKIVDESDGKRDLIQFFDDRITLSVDYTVVPEPATMLLLGIGAVTLVRRKK